MTASILLGSSLDLPRSKSVDLRVENPEGYTKNDLFTLLILRGLRELKLLWDIMEEVRGMRFSEINIDDDIPDAVYSSIENVFNTVYARWNNRRQDDLSFKLTRKSKCSFLIEECVIYISAPWMLWILKCDCLRERKAAIAALLYHELYHAFGFIRDSEREYELLRLRSKESRLIYHITREEIAAHAFERAVRDVFLGHTPFSVPLVESDNYYWTEYRYLILYASPEKYPKMLQNRIRLAHRGYRMLVPAYHRLIREKLLSHIYYLCDGIWECSDTI